MTLGSISGTLWQVLPIIMWVAVMALGIGLASRAVFPPRDRRHG